MANIPEESIDAEAASCLQYVAIDAFKDKELTDHQQKQKRDDLRIQHDFSAAALRASLSLSKVAGVSGPMSLVPLLLAAT